MFIYLATNLINGKKYVGQTCSTIAKRWRRHTSKANSPSAKGRRELFIMAIRKYGKEGFAITQLDTASNEIELAIKEEFFASMLNTYAPNGYNLQQCGLFPVRHQFTNDKIAKTYQFLSPEGVVTDITNLAQFCKEHSLDHCHMYHVAQGKRVAHKGWRTVQQKHKVYIIQHKDTKQTKEVIDAYGFKRKLANELGMHESALRALITGKAKSAKNWVLHDIKTI